ncbi:MAG: hypothetical protein Q8L88_02240 [Bacteroidota bacterium]|nr:hypothetical protein [Bacteroidota bacterium]
MATLTIKEIINAQIEEVKSLIPTLKTIAHYEGKFTPEHFERNLTLAPFDLIFFDDDVPRDEQRIDQEFQTLRDMTFVHVVGSRSLLSREESNDDCYTILDQLEEGLEGKRLTANGILLPAFKQGRRFWVETTKSGLVIYQASYILTFNKQY